MWIRIITITPSCSCTSWNIKHNKILRSVLCGLKDTNASSRLGWLEFRACTYIPGGYLYYYSLKNKVNGNSTRLISNNTRGYVALHLYFRHALPFIGHLYRLGEKTNYQQGCDLLKKIYLSKIRWYKFEKSKLYVGAYSVWTDNMTRDHGN